VGSPDTSPGTAAQGRATHAASRDLSRAKSCPSSLCQEDALLLGVVAPGGTLAYVQPPTHVSAEFAWQAQALGHPERRFRFSRPCVEAACPQWTGSGCGVIDVVIGSRPAEPATGPMADPAARPPEPPPALPACAIRRTCRWFAQHGAAACAVCPTIIADTGGTTTYRSAHMTSSSTGPQTDGQN
jgi:hypothetical protein